MNFKNVINNTNICIIKNKDSQKNMACWLLLRYLTTKIEFQAEFSIQSGYAPVIESVYENPVYAEFLLNEDGASYITARSNKVTSEQEEAFYTSPAFVGSSEARDQVGAMLDAILLDTSDKSIADYFNEAIATLKAIK